MEETRFAKASTFSREYVFTILHETDLVYSPQRFLVEFSSAEQLDPDRDMLDSSSMSKSRLIAPLRHFIRPGEKRKRRISRHTQTAALLRLPTETLVAIVRLVPPTGALRACEVLSHICVRLRDIMLDLPDLWSVVDFPLHWSARRLQNYTSIILQRAKDRPIQIVARESKSKWKENLPSIMRAFRDAFNSLIIGEIESLELHLYSMQAGDLPAQMLDALPRTPRSLCIRHAISPVHQTSPDRQLMAYSDTTFICPITSLHLPEVENITLFNIRGKVLVNPSEQALQWQSLRVEVDESGARESPSSSSVPVGMLVQYCKRLESLYIGRHTHGYINVLHEMPLLKELYIHDIWMLTPTLARNQGTLFPRLVKFGTCVSRGTQLEKFLRSHPTILDLTLDAEFRADVVAEASPQVKVLRITMSNWIDIAEPLLGGVCGVTDSQTPFQFSAVEELHLHNRCGYITPESFDRLVKRRIVDARRNSSLVAMHTISIHGLSLGGDGSLSLEWRKSRYAQSARICWEDDACTFSWPSLDAQ